MTTKVLITGFFLLTGILCGQVKTDSLMTSEVTIKVPTVKCNSCVKTVTSAVRKLEGIESVSIDKPAKVVVVKFDAKKATVTDIETVISKSGYDANKSKRDAAAYEKLDDCCK